MDYLLTTCFLCIIIVVASGKEPTYIATFSMNGAYGNVLFVENAPGNTTIRVNMTLPSGTYDWAVFERPVLYEQRPSCDESFTGEILVNLSAAHGQITATETDTFLEFTNSKLKFSGRNNILGRSLVLIKTQSSTRICANVLDYQGDVMTAVARFMSPFAGTVIFRQRQDMPSADTTILVDLYQVVVPLESTTYKWKIHSVNNYNNDMDLQKRCSNTQTAVFNPTGADDTSCESNDPQYCPIGNLWKKHGDITVVSTSNSRTRYFIDSSLPLNQTENLVVGKNLVFTKSDGTFIACSPIQQLLPKTVSAKISVSGVRGRFEFTQRSPFDPTIISYSLYNLRQLAGGYHVHEYPTTTRLNTDDKPASKANAGGHYNPFGINAKLSPEAGTGTHDMYEVGDLSGKFGLLTNASESRGYQEDWNLQLFGKYSIVGRSIVIHKVVGNERWAYGNIGYPGEVKTVKADLGYIVAGHVVFRQDPSDPFADTSVYIDVVHTDSSTTSTNHNFHVHEKPIANDYTAETGRCSSAAGHFNPFVDVSKNVYYRCSFDHPLRCEVGDLSQKLSTIDIPRATESSKKYFFTDPMLPLSGFYSVSSRSVVIHIAERGAGRYACANLYEVPPVSIKTSSWVGDPSPIISGEITVSQASVFDLAKVDIQLSGLGSQAGGWHVHVLPIDPDNSDAPCSPVSVFGHYNPYKEVGSPANGTDDMYEVGDFSGKFGSLSGLDSISELYMDSNVDLSGPLSIAGRPIVVHRDDVGGSRMLCSDADFNLAPGDFTLVARASFQGESSGVVTFRQTRFASGYQGDTRLEVDLASNVDDVEYSLKIPQETCSDDDDGIYNPYGIPFPTNRCSLSRMRLCAVGDLTTKHGATYSNQRAVYTDINLPLFGLNSVIGRPLAIQTPNGEKTCTLITPDDNLGQKVNHLFPSTVEFDAYDFQMTVANAIADGNRWQVVVSSEPVPSTTYKNCNSVEFWILGPNADDLARAFTAAVKAGSLGSYNPTKLCSSDTGGGATVIPSGLAVILSTLLGIAIAMPLRPGL